ncbi:6046_t:CDS:1, partial [Cetraspora pellucida]
MGTVSFKEDNSDEQNTARMKSSTDLGGQLPSQETTSYDRDFGGMKKQLGAIGTGMKEEHAENVSTQIKTTTHKGSSYPLVGKAVTPAHYYVNTTALEYDFYELHNRSMSNPFEIRFDYSDQLYNSLVNCNHASPAQVLDRIAFSSLQSLVRR